MKQTPQDEQNDPHWDLLKNASEQKASSSFSRDVLRAIRLEDSQPVAWWKSPFAIKSFIGASAIAACAFVAITSLNQPQQRPNDSPSITTNSQTEPDTELNQFDELIEDDILISEMLIAFSEEPDAFVSSEVFEIVGL